MGTWKIIRYQDKQYLAVIPTLINHPLFHRALPFSKMQAEIKLQITLIKPTPDVVFGLQKGSGNTYDTVQKQQSGGHDLIFNFSVNVKGDPAKDRAPKFSGVFVQGPPDSRFIYIDIGTYAGQVDSNWSRRLKVPLTGITWKDIDELLANQHSILQTHVPGVGKDGGPNCATVKPFVGWHHSST